MEGLEFAEYADLRTSRSNCDEPKFYQPISYLTGSEWSLDRAFFEIRSLRSTVKGITTCEELSRHLRFQLCPLA